jgi:hypothetical protein
MIRIEISESELVDGKWTPITAAARGLVAGGRVPVLSLCRQLVATGHDQAEAAEVYRGTILALRIRSLGEAAGLTVVETDKLGPSFAAWKPFPGLPSGRPCVFSSHGC